MTLEEITSEGHGVTKNRLIGCPLCGHEYEKNEPRWLLFLEEHGPADVQLTR